MARTKISYFGKKVYIGIDVHKETYSVACICEGVIVKKVTSVPQARQNLPNLFAIGLRELSSILPTKQVFLDLIFPGSLRRLESKVLWLTPLPLLLPITTR